MKTEIVIRTDGGPMIGLGHLVRCIALAQMLKNDFRIKFFAKEIPDKIRSEIIEFGFRLRIIEAEEEFLDELKSDKIAVLDGYGFDFHFQKRIRETGCTLVCIDDLHDREFDADLIINHTPGIQSKDYKAQPYTLFALGPEYVLLRPAFLEQVKRGREDDKIERLLIAFGGSDPKGITERALQVVLEFNVFKKIIVVTGAAFEPNHDFSQLLLSDKRVEHRHAIGEEEMMKTFCEADLAVLPASGVLIEALVTGCTIIAGCYVANQKLVYESFKKAGLFFDAGNLGTEEIRQAINDALARPKLVKTVFDGNSRERIVKIFKDLQREDLIILRKADKEDLELTFRWATNIEIRRYSFQQHNITHPEHTLWFSGKLNHPACVYLIGETDRIPFGSIRFDIEDNEAIISYLVDPVLHGQGFGLILLKKGIEKFVFIKDQQGLTIRTLCGVVLKSNIPSIKSFERLGFEKVELEGQYRFIKQV